MAVDSPWSYTSNQFFNSTVGSYRLAIRINEYHFAAISKMAGEPFFDTMITAYSPFYRAVKDAYDKWRTQTGLQQAQTLQLEQQLIDLSTNKIKSWDISIQAVFVNTTPGYKALLPNNRGPFQRGSQEDRITAVSALIQAIGSNPALVAVKEDAQAFLKAVTETIFIQKGEISSTKTCSDALEKARVDMCTAMYANLGGLMQYYAGTPQNIGQYFDLSVIRSGTQLVFVGETKPTETKNIVKRTLKPGTSLLLKNEGVTDLLFFLAGQKKDVSAANMLKLTAGATITVTASQLGDISHTFLNVQNPDSINSGEWSVEFV